MQARVERKREQQQQETVLETAMEVNEIGNQMINMAQDKQMVEIPSNDIIPQSNSKKRKRNVPTKIDRHLSKSLSRLSIAQGCSKKTKKNVASNNVLTKMIHELNGQPKISTKNLKSTFVPQYLTVSNRKFKEMLSKVVHDGHQIYEWLDSDQKLKSTRELAHIFNLMNYLTLQQQLWQDYFDIGMNDGVWAPRVSKSKAKEHNTCVSYGRSEKFVEQRQKTIQHQLNRTDHQLQQHLTQLPEWTEKVQPSIDSTFLSNAIQAMVKNGLYRLNAQFKHKQAMLKFDADDHRLIAAVYDLKPTEEQVGVYSIDSLSSIEINEIDCLTFQVALLKIYWQAVADEQKALAELEVLRKRVSLRQLPKSFDKILNQSIASIQTMLSRPILNKDRRASMASRYSKTITQYKFDMMAMTIAIAQDTARGHAQLAVDTKNKLRLLDGDQIRSSTELLINSMETRAENMKKRAQELLQYKLMSFFRAGSVGGQRQRQRIRRSNLSIYTNITASSPFIETDLNLSLIQMSMLIKGLKYIPPCQSRFSRQSIDAIVNEQYKTLRTIVQGCLDDHRMQLVEPREKEGFPSLKRILYELQSKKLPCKLEIRARRERKVVQSIINILRQRPDITVRRTDKSKVFYVGNATVFAEKASKYMIETKAYQEISNEHCILSESHHLVTTLLVSLLKKGAINQEQHKNMSPKTDTLELAHLHFIPKPHKPDTPLRPIVAAIHAPATEVSKFLNDLLAPVFLRVARKTTFINGIDLVRTLEKYVADGHLKPTTLFITFDVENLYTMIPRQGALEALMQFLERHLHNKKIGTLRIDDIMRMARLVLDTNIFAYENKYYRQIRGGAMGSAFTQTLANIYMLDWEQKLIQNQEADKEIYGR
ncbi:unnamed protein product, partial [Rotaria sp. Silwood1]